MQQKVKRKFKTKSSEKPRTAKYSISKIAVTFVALNNRILEVGLILYQTKNIIPRRKEKERKRENELQAANILHLNYNRNSTKVKWQIFNTLTQQCQCWKQSKYVSSNKKYS